MTNLLGSPARGGLRPARMVGRLYAMLLFAIALATLPAHSTIHYDVSVAQPETHLLHVTMTIPDVRNQVLVQLPAWNALYQIRDFAYHVEDVHATDEALKPLEAVKLDKQTWRLEGQGTITVRYASFWNEPGPFSSQLNGTHAFLNLATFLFYVPDRRREDVQIVFADLPPAWRIAVELRPEEAPAGHRPTAYHAANYDTLVDAPVELGTFSEFRLDAGGRPIRVVVHGDGQDDVRTRGSLMETLGRIVSYQVELMGGAPFAEYLFIYHIGSAAEAAGGGMEHANSSAISVNSAADLSHVTAHEFFHVWNVKRIRPQSLEPVDDAREQWTRALWFVEGVTNTYASYTLVRTGLWSRKQFLDELASEITELELRPARRWKSVEEASLDAWFEKYPLYRRPEFSISYYNKGQILGVLLDILIRDSTGNRAGLDDVVRYLNDNFARRGRFYRDTADIRVAAEAVFRRATGRADVPAEFAEFFSRYVAGTHELPCADFLARAGLVLKVFRTAGATFGFWPVRGPEGVSIAVGIEPGSTADRAGVLEGDTLLELDGAPFPRRADRWLRDHRAGQPVRLRLRRGSEEREVSFVLSERQDGIYEIEEATNATEKQRRILDGLLSDTTSGPRP